MDLNLFIVGASHKTAPLSTLEKLTRFQDGNSQNALSWTRDALGGAGTELCLLQTCNRYEIYGVGPLFASGRLAQKLKEETGLLNGAAAAIYELNGEQALEHAFNVAGGLDSLIIGESEILGQVKDAYERARRSGFTGAVLNTVFQRALYAGKKVRTMTRLSQGRLSVASVAVELAQKIFESFHDLTVAVIGAGAVGMETAKNLLLAGPKEKIFLSRTLERAQALADDYGGRASTLDELGPSIASADVVITHLSVPAPIIGASLVRTRLSRRGRGLFFLDLALPRNVDEAVAQLPNVFLYNLDDLKSIAQENFESRRAEAEKSRLIIKEEVARFLPQCRQRLNATSLGLGQGVPVSP